MPRNILVRLLVCLSVWRAAAAMPTSEPDKMPMDNGGMMEGQGDTPPGLNIRTDMDALHFLMRMGWMKPQSTKGMTMDSMGTQMVDEYHQGLTNYQQAFGLHRTGEADSATMAMMRTPRCSVPDNDMTSSTRHKRYVLQGSKWDKKDLTYLIQSYTPDLSRRKTNTVIRQAFNYWERVANLRFTEVTSGAADIVIKFVRGNHGDGNPFDGPSGVLAHAYYPRYGGNAHFDDAETWTIRAHSGFNLLQVAVHEFGHSLGLAHSRDRAAIMYPSYQGYTPDFALGQDDINGIRALYGPPTAPGSTPPTPKPTTTTPERVTGPCDVSKWDAVVTTQDGTTYFFAGSEYYKAGDKTPRSVASDWGVRGQVTSAVTLSNGYSVLFQGQNFHMYHNQRKFDTQVRRTSSYFPGLPDTFEAAWIFRRNNKFYVSRGQQYWRYNGQERAFDSYYPEDFNSVWRGAPEAVDAATTDAKGQLHFFRGSYYYTLDSDAVAVLESGKLIGNNWFQCGSGALEDTSYMGSQGDDKKMVDMEMENVGDEFADELMKRLEEEKVEENGASAFDVSLLLSLASFLFFVLL